ncbi:hypothetical protein GLOIN_2v1515096 [Rhizophagus irregularis DAOM 181602=DAOM 197198]|uniref:Uncharacterized protein n=1 Tax=Rhizophagus irregularis (strain DAOM 181602 / DAOM 197198 / MUCL 43194) TaxID=747089 RepID=A0A2P4QSV9_RHIID|nr:hypothetical protein GLOIN_2v1515096 [Rhizophagus irregularis DAOM 181602=DAOM 197198]POG80720.1 hypothetical protein GLOIN_2v1515096 [Rhizophagus irregularis DAOM 181602=DAOM 197198]GBC31351.2 hypothetical protein GLOIN_2v1515096 [Rhizophagus irregularis DAOM 181602=DAOM 197198]|eukprot:XP_025187586.1 hypothetical protein GLOIN_2v1515096 [Rhizophagus irregularis DAOM 181602=DAOM 197198]
MTCVYSSLKNYDYPIVLKLCFMSSIKSMCIVYLIARGSAIFVNLVYYKSSIIIVLLTHKLISSTILLLIFPLLHEVMKIYFLPR